MALLDGCSTVEWLALLNIYGTYHNCRVRSLDVGMILPHHKEDVLLEPWGVPSSSTRSFWFWPPSPFLLLCGQLGGVECDLLTWHFQEGPGTIILNHPFGNVFFEPIMLIVGMVYHYFTHVQTNSSWTWFQWPSWHDLVRMGTSARRAEKIPATKPWNKSLPKYSFDMSSPWKLCWCHLNSWFEKIWRQQGMIDPQTFMNMIQDIQE